MTSTADAVLQAMRGMGLKLIEKGGEYRSNSPLRPGSDSNGFALKIEDGEHGAWQDHATGETGSLYDLAKRLNIATPSSNGNSSGATLADSKRPYTGLVDYAKAHGVEASVFEAAGWRETTYLNRKALAIPTANGVRYRFIDGDKPSYINETGYVPCFYGFPKVLDMARQSSMLLLCNGEASTVVAHHYGIPAFATTGGEKRLPDVLLQQFKAQWGKHLIIAFDCDTAGRAAAKSVAEQYPDSTVIDLGLGEHGDLADFCHLYGADTKKRLTELINKSQQPAGIASDKLARDYIKSLDDRAYSGTSFRFPFPSFHEFGGYASLCEPGKMIGILAPSGGGKTAFVETFADILAQRGYDGMFYGPEWTAMETVTRRVARYGGSNLETLGLFRLWNDEASKRIPESQRQGRNLTDSEYQRNGKIAAELAKWPGLMYWYPTANVLESTIETMERDLHILRLKGRSVAYAIFDYAQLLQSAERDSAVNRFELAVERIKTFTQVNNIVAIVVSQINKDASAGQQNTGRAVTGDDAHFLRDFKFNLFFSLNRNYEKDTRSGELIIQNTGYVQVTKNSGGRTGRVTIKPELERYTWVDPKANKRTFNNV